MADFEVLNVGQGDSILLKTLFRMQIRRENGFY